MPVIGVQGVQTVHHVVRLPVGGGVAQGEQGVELAQALPSLAALHALGLVNDENRPGGRDDVDGAAAPEAVRPLVDDPLVPARVERLHVDDHNVDIGTCREAVDVTQTAAVVDKVADGLAVLLKKVLLGILERFVDALADGDRGHHDDELGPAIEAVELEHGLGIDVGLARARLHLHIKVYRGGASSKRRRLDDAITALHLVNVLEQRSGAKGNRGIRIALGCLDLRLKARQCRGAVTAHRTAKITQIERGARVGLTGKDIGHRTSSLSLIRLNFKLELHLTLHPPEQRQLLRA